MSFFALWGLWRGPHEEIPLIEQQEVQWHLAQMFSRLDLDEKELERVVYVLRKWKPGGDQQREKAAEGVRS